jgi:high-affinity K+ transport system ATPase subunit B
VVEEVARELGIDEYYAGHSPIAKAALIERLVRDGRMVCGILKNTSRQTAMDTTKGRLQQLLSVWHGRVIKK